MTRATKKLLLYFILPLALLLAVVLIAQQKIQPDFKLHVNFFESGAKLLRTYQGNKIVIDGGSDDQILSALGQALPFYDHEIDLLVLTKADNQHATGLVHILKRYQVNQIFLPEGELNSSALRELLVLIQQKHLKRHYIQTNQRVWLDDATILDLSSNYLIFGSARIDLNKTVTKDEEIVSDGVYKN